MQTITFNNMADFLTACAMLFGRDIAFTARQTGGSIKEYEITLAGIAS